MKKSSEPIQGTTGDGQSRPSTGLAADQGSEPVEKPAERSGRAEEGPGLQSTLETLSLVVGPTTLLAALLFYFGWVYTQALYGYFGIDLSTVDFTTQDYIQRAIVPVLPPLILTVAFVLGVMWLYNSLYRIRAGGHMRGLKWASRSAMAGGSLITLFGLLGVSGILDSVCIGKVCPWAVEFATPLAIMFGPVTLSYGVRLGRIVADRSMAGGGPRWHARAILALIFLMIALGTFGLFGDWASRSGAQWARELARDVACNNLGVVVYSKQQLPLAGDGVTRETIQGSDGDYRFQYGGLVLFIRSGHRLFLLPEKWSPSSGSVIVLPESDAILVEYTPGKC
jgi:hypothetical protein